MTMTTTAGIAETFQSLLDSDHAYQNQNSYNADDESDCDSHDVDLVGEKSSSSSSSSSLEERQGRLCEELAQLLISTSSGGSGSGSGGSSDNLRTVLGSKNVSAIMAPVLGPLLTHRVDRDALLPGTQDYAANVEVLDSSTNAMTLTAPALQAAWLYSQLLALPGALGSGLVDLEWLTALCAVVRRWTLESCGREDYLLSVTSSSNANANTANSNKNKNKKKYPKSPSKSPPKKKSRRKPPQSLVVELESDEEEEDFARTSTSRRTPHSILQAGLHVALAVCQVPLQREFSSWSSEAREVVLDAMTAAFGTAAALVNLQHPACPQIVEQASEAWQVCLLQSSTNNNNNKAQRHETSVVVLRGLLHLLQLKEVLPNGERGKLDAHAAASRALQGIMERMSSSSSTTFSTTSSRRKSGTKALTDASNQPHTPSRHRRRRSSGLAVTPVTTNGKTPKSARKRRTSLDGVTPMLSPALKGRRSSGILSGWTTTSSPHYPKPRPVWSVFVGMLQKLATTQGLERASARSPTVLAVLQCLATLPLAERAHFLRYAHKLCHSKVSLHRLVACELLGHVLQQDWLPTHDQDVVVVLQTTTAAAAAAAANPVGQSSPETPPSVLQTEDTTTTTTSPTSVSLPMALWKALQGRLVDRMAAVRARAATSLETAIGRHPDWLDDRLLTSLRKRATRDETATVRRAAVLALTQVLLVVQQQNKQAPQDRKDFLCEAHVTALCDLCQDSSLLTRKAAAASLTQLLEAYVDHPMGNMLEEAWSLCVLPMVLDEEAGNKAIDGMNRVVIGPILDHSEHHQVAWRLLAYVANASGQQGASKGARQALQAGLQQMAQEDPQRIHQQLLKRVAQVAYQTLQEDETSEAQVVGVWCLLEALLSSQKSNHVAAMVKTLKRTPQGLHFSVSAWKTLLDRQNNCQTPAPWLRGTLRSCLWVVSQLASGLDATAAQECHASLLLELQAFALPPEVTGAAIGALTAVSTRMDGNVRTICAAWIRSTFSSCEVELASFVQDMSQEGYTISSERQQRLIRALFTVGELSMVGFRPDDDERDIGHKNDDADDLLRGMHEMPPKRLREMAQTLLSPRLPGSTRVVNPTPVRAHAFTVLGKLCLRDEGLAKSSLNLLARELHPSLANPIPSVQSNALLVLGDLCVRYTNMADRYLPVMASCLQAGTSDPETDLLNNNNGTAIVRKHAVLLLSSLLLQDYIKWRGLLFHRFLVACSDEDEEVAALAESVLSGPLWTRNSKLFFNNFVESLFVLNKCTAHPIYISATNQGDGGSGIAVGFEGIYLNGQMGKLRRRRMYEFLLSKLTDEEKIGVTARLAKEVLGGAVSSEGDLGRVCEVSTKDFGPQLESAWNVMTDAFYILTSKGIKVGKVNEEDNHMEDPNVLPNASRQVTVAKSRLLSKISRKHLIEIVLPILCNLKTKLQSSCSPLLKDLMTYLLEIFRNYKVEVKEFLANDPTLLQEIEYDARQAHGAKENHSQ